MKQFAFTDTEFAVIIDDKSKKIDGDIDWDEDEDHSPAREFRCEIFSNTKWPLFVQGRCNLLAGTLSFSIILNLKTVGRIYALDMGKDHHNPQCHQVGEKHMHKWSDKYRDKKAYVPKDITESISNPAAVWRQFCAEANIQHDGKMAPLPLLQEEMFYGE